MQRFPVNSSTTRNNRPGISLWPRLQAAADGFGEGFMLPTVILAAYFWTLSDNWFVIGAIPFLTYGLWSIGSMIGSLISGSSRRLRSVAITCAVLKAVMMGGITYLAFLDNRTTQDILRLTLVLIGIFGFVGGFGFQARNATLAAATAPSRRSAVFVERTNWAAWLAPLAGLVVYQVMNATGIDEHRAYALGFLASTSAFATSAFLLLLIHGRGSSTLLTSRQISVSALTRENRSTIVSLTVFRFFLAASALGDVFLIIFALTSLNMPNRFLGVAVIVFGIALALFLPLLRIVARSRGGRAALQIAALAKILPPLVALSIPYLNQTDYYQQHVSNDRYLYWAIVGSFAFIGLAIAAVSAGSHRYLEDSLPQRSRFAAERRVNGALIVATLSALAGGAIVDHWDFTALFGTAAAVALAATILSGILEDVKGSDRLPTASRLAQTEGYRSVSS